MQHSRYLLSSQPTAFVILTVPEPNVFVFQYTDAASFTGFYAQLLYLVINGNDSADGMMQAQLSH